MVATILAMMIWFTKVNRIADIPFGYVWHHFLVGSSTDITVKDIYCAEWLWLILFAPERICGMITSMLQDYEEVGFSIYKIYSIKCTNARVVGFLCGRTSLVRFSRYLLWLIVILLLETNIMVMRLFSLSFFPRAEAQRLGRYTCGFSDCWSCHQRCHRFRSGSCLWRRLQRCDSSASKWQKHVVCNRSFYITLLSC